MAQQTINVGAAPNDGTGTPLRTAFQYTNSNFSELYTAVGPSGNNIVVPGNATITGNLTVDTNVFKVDTTSNQVGIGTASPAYAADISIASVDGLRVKNTLATSAYFNRFHISNNTGINFIGYGASFSGGTILGLGAGSNSIFSDAAAPFGIATTVNQPLVFGINGSTAMTLNSTGLGVGVASPAQKLDVAGSIYISNNAAYLYGKTSGGLATRTFGINAANDVYVGSIDQSINNIRFNSGGTDRLLIDSSGNVGIGVTPSAWNGGGYVQLQNSRAYAFAGAFGDYISNGYYDGSWKYTTTAAVSRYRQDAGSHQWLTAPSGTAGNAITFTQAMTLTAAGDLLVGTTGVAGSASNSTKTVGGLFSTVNGSTASTASGAAVTMFTSPAEATFMVSAYIFGTGAPASYNAIAIVKVSGSTAAITTVSSATGLTISLSGLNVQVTQTSGSAQVIVYSAIRIS